MSQQHSWTSGIVIPILKETCSEIIASMIVIYTLQKYDMMVVLTLLWVISVPQSACVRIEVI